MFYKIFSLLCVLNAACALTDPHLDANQNDMGNNQNNSSENTCPYGFSQNWDPPESYCQTKVNFAVYPQIEDCKRPINKAQYLVVTTTDFSTGALSIASREDYHIDNDVALGGTDTIPFFAQGFLYLVHRFRLDYIDVLDPCQSFRSLGQFSLNIDQITHANPHAIHFRDDGLAFVTLFGAPYMLVMDLHQKPEQAIINLIDLTAFADADGNPETSLIIPCHDTLFVSAQRLNEFLLPADKEHLIAVDMRSCKPYSHSIELLGTYAKQFRPDPQSTDGTSVFVLTTGIEKINLKTGKAEWVISEDHFAMHNITLYQLQAFALNTQGNKAFVAAYTPDYLHIEIYAITLSSPPIFKRILQGFNAQEKSIEVLGNELWIGDTTPGQEGLVVFDINFGPPKRLAGPLSTGLPPYSVIAVP